MWFSASPECFQMHLSALKPLRLWPWVIGCQRSVAQRRRTTATEGPGKLQGRVLRDGKRWENEKQKSNRPPKPLQFSLICTCFYPAAIQRLSLIGSLFHLSLALSNSSPLSPLVSYKLITLLTLLDFLWTVHLALFLWAALPLLHCLFTLWQQKGEQYWARLTGGEGTSVTLRHAKCNFITLSDSYSQNRINHCRKSRRRK